MKSTLNNLALFSFRRKAKKLGKRIEVANLMDQGFFEEYLVRAGETLIIWSEENAFHTIFTEIDCELAYLVDFPDKYGHDEVYHFGILNKDKTKLYLYRCYDQLNYLDGILVYGLQYQTEQYRKNQDYRLYEESTLPFLETGNMSRL